MKKIFNGMPIWLINMISVLSGILTILTSIIGTISFFKNRNISTFWIIIIFLLFDIVLVIQIRKYKKLYFKGLKVTSFNYHKLLHDSRDIYFDIMKNHKEHYELDPTIFTSLYQEHLSSILTYLCNILEEYCNQKVSSCIKIVVEPNQDYKKVILRTFCRSNNSDSERGNYEKYQNNNKIILGENTDFWDIVDSLNGTNTNYFYKQNLVEYDKELQKHNKRYLNSNPNWKKDYIGTIVVPIQIQQNKLYDSKSKNVYHVIGFLCVDSLSDCAFLDRQAKFNIDIVKSFADVIFMLLSQYQHYLKKMSKSQEEEK